MLSIISPFFGNSGSNFIELPPSISAQVDYVPFDWLLPKVSLVVCHGGAGTTFRAIGAGASTKN